MKPIHVAYSAAELKAGVSVQTIIEGKARAIFARAGRLYVLTGASYYLDDAVFTACVATPVGDYKGTAMTYAERSEYPYRLPDDHADRIRSARRFYEGIRVRCRAATYVLGAESECWVSMGQPRKRS